MKFVIRTNNQFESHSIDGIQVRTPKNVMVSGEFMEKVIESLKKQQNAMLEHVKGKGRLFSLLCPALGWLKHREENSTKQEKLEKIRIVYAYYSKFDQQYLEEQLRKIDYQPKISQINQQDNIQINDEDDLILIDQQSLLNSDLTAFQNSILIIDDAHQPQDNNKLLGQIEKSTIQKAINELVELFNDLQKMNNQDQKQFLQEYEFETIKIFQQRLLVLNKKFDNCENIRFSDHPIFQFIQDFISIYDKNMMYSQIQVQKNYLICSKLAKLSQLKAFADFFKFLQVAVICYQEKKYKYPNYEFKVVVDQINKQDKIEINVKYYLTHLQSRLEKLQFQSVILSSDFIQPKYLPNFHIYHTFDKREYFQTVLLQIKWASNLYDNLLMNLERFVKSIPNGILVIFSSFTSVQQFRQHCLEQQPNFFGVIEKYKKLFWGLDQKKNEIVDYIKCSEKGAILFESYEKIFNKNYHFPGHLCKGLIIAQLRALSQNCPDYSLHCEDDITYKHWNFDKILERTLLYENDKGVLIIFSLQKQIEFWYSCLKNQFRFEYDENQITEWFKNDQNSQNDDMLIEWYYPQREQTKTKIQKQQKKRTNQQDQEQDEIVQMSEHSQKIKKVTKKQNQRQSQGYSKNKKSKRQIKSNEQQEQQEIEEEEQENFIQQKKEETEKKQKNKNPKKNKEEQSKVKKQSTLEKFINKVQSAKKNTDKDDQDSNKSS
ncbi:unnamed protein product [Paramecium octaurelia]|uniref:ATP-dependent helicase C-terminal domain-containing protein n=1 Tax=Paramecium octaurelia TaxID=43137 RepID=A0A8S1UNG1_PAROT|nr:unnamed protein product [Paramecium octaurelia]